MSNVPLFIDLVRDRMLTIPLVIEKGFIKKTLYKRFVSQMKPETVKYPCMTLCYDMDKRGVWAPVDDLKLYLTVHMDVYEDMMPIVDAVVDSLHLFMDASTCVTVYKCWNCGGPPAPMYNEKTNRWEATLEFDVSIA